MWEQRLGRLFNILSFLSPYSQVTVEDLAHEYQVDEKTIKRDLRMLEEARMGIFRDDGKIKISRIGYQRIRSWMLA